MFDGLTGRLGEIFDRLRKRGALSESDVGEALREVRVALLEADVALPVAEFRDHLQLGSGFADDGMQDSVLIAQLRAALAAVQADPLAALTGPADLAA